jgi:hypothetical protein
MPDASAKRAMRLAPRSAVARTVDAETVAVFRNPADHACHLDRRFGALTPSVVIDSGTRRGRSPAEGAATQNRGFIDGGSD